MKRQMLNRLSRLFTTTATNNTTTTATTTTATTTTATTTTTSATTTTHEPTHYNYSTVKQKQSPTHGTTKKSRWSTLGLGKKTKRPSIPVGEWLSSMEKPAEKDTPRDSAISSTPTHVGCYFDEKVEIIVPSASIHSFFSTSSTHSAPFCFSSSSMSPQPELDDHLHTPRTSIDDQESLKEETYFVHKAFGLGNMVNHTLSDAFVVADHDIFDKDDFYD